MTKHTYMRASDGTIFLPEPVIDRIHFCQDNAKAFKQGIEYEEQLKQTKQDNKDGCN
jgi:hypothetical protein